jgi:DNA-directed RNA polymerase specialized sigma24 family protein
LQAIAARNLARYGAAATKLRMSCRKPWPSMPTLHLMWAAPSPWIAAIARHKLIDMLRRRGFHQTVPIEVIAETMPCSGPAPDMGHDAERMLDCLGERQRAIVRSMSIEGASV